MAMVVTTAGGEGEGDLYYEIRPDLLNQLPYLANVSEEKKKKDKHGSR